MIFFYPSVRTTTSSPPPPSTPKSFSSASFCLALSVNVFLNILWVGQSSISALDFALQHWRHMKWWHFKEQGLPQPSPSHSRTPPSVVFVSALISCFFSFFSCLFERFSPVSPSELVLFPVSCSSLSRNCLSAS